LSTSRTRTERVTDDGLATEALANLAKIIESKRSAVEKLSAHSKVVRQFPEVAVMLKSSHVKDPKGETITAFPGYDQVVRDARVVRSGLKAAVKHVIRKMVPSSASTAALIEACYSGTLFGASECAIADLAQPSKAKAYIGVLAAPASNTAAKTNEAKLIVLLKALPLIGFVLSQVQPEDDTVGLVMTEIGATFARGVAARGVAEAVQGILVPFFRAYEETFARFQKSASVDMPIMEEVWSDELSNPTVLAFMSLVGTSEAVKGTPVDANELEQLRARVAAMEKQPRRQQPGGHAQPPAAPALKPPADSGKPPPQLTPADPNSKRSLAKAKAAAEAAAAGAAPPAAAGI
jgi:hypothetical protein